MNKNCVIPGLILKMTVKKLEVNIIFEKKMSKLVK